MAALQVPFVAQQTRECGPAALYMALRASGAAPSLPRLVEQTYTPGRGGALAHDLIAAARRQGRIAYPIEGFPSLLEELAAGHPVIVLQNLRLQIWPLWHFAVAIGYDLSARELVMHSGRREFRRVPLDTFRRTWKRADRWGLLVLAPGELPARASRADYLAAVAGLERAGQPEAAALAYRAAIQRWPDEVVARLGLANALRARGELEAAEVSIREALVLAPGLGAAHNNLADILLLQGKPRAALASVERAIALDGERHEYVQTRAEIWQALGPPPADIKTGH
jgi:tetratricopeptide (TPR) repeat protein